MISRRLRIVHITNNYTPYSGGVVSSINAIVKGLQKEGHQAVVVSFAFVADHADDPDWVIRIACPVRFRYFSNHMVMPWMLAKKLNAVLHTVKPDIIHVHHPFLLGQAGLEYGKRHGIPVIFTHHTFYERYLHYAPVPAQLVRPWVQQRVRIFCQNVDGIIAPSSSVASYLDDLGVKQAPFIIPSPIASYFFADHGFGKKKMVQEPIRLLTVGRFVQEKNIPFLLEVIAQLDPKRFQVTMVGFGTLFTSLQKYAYQQLAIPKQQLQFVHKPEKKDLLAHYKQAHLFLFSSVTDTQGLVLAEAMAFGTPVIALNGPGQRDIIESGVNGFLVANKQEMVEKIVSATASPKEYQRLSQGAAKTALRYCPEHTVRKVLHVYRSVE